MQAARFAPFFQAVTPINSTPVRSRITAITTDNSISVVPRWRICLLLVLISFILVFLFWFLGMVGLDPAVSSCGPFIELFVLQASDPVEL